jgi:hypothetical protein
MVLRTYSFTNYAKSQDGIHCILGIEGNMRRRKEEQGKDGRKWGFFLVLYLTLLHLPLLRFHCAGGCWNRNQDSGDNGIGCQTL